jgi:hypothetical protein
MICIQIYQWLKIHLLIGKVKQYQEETNLQTQLIENLQYSETQLLERLEQLEEKLLVPIIENEQVTKQLTHRTQTLQRSLDEQKEAIKKINQQQPEDKLYSRALKLVKLGAGLEEIMQECELPKAEVELLLSMHNNYENG